MEDELKVSPCKNSVHSLKWHLFCLRHKCCLICLVDVFSTKNIIILIVLAGTSSQAPFTHSKWSTPKVFLQSRTHISLTAELWLARWVWSQGERRLVLQAHYPQCSAGPLPARLRRSLCCCSPAPLIPLLGWTLWPSSSWIPNPIQEQKTCFCETFLCCSVCIPPHKETQGTTTKRCQAWVKMVCNLCGSNYKLHDKIIIWLLERTNQHKLNCETQT